MFLGAVWTENIESTKRTAVAFDFSGTTPQKWQHNLFVATQTGGTSVVVIDPAQGNAARVFPVSVPGVPRLVIRDISVSPGGDLAVSASATSGGRAGGAIVLLSSSGEIQRTISTAPFMPWSIAFAPDGTIWAAGSDHDDLYKELDRYDVLRHYDVSGKLLGSTLPVETFTRDRNNYPAIVSKLVASKERLGFYSQPSHEWVELDLSGKVLGRWKSAAFEKVTGAVITPAGDAFLSVQLPRAKGVLYKLDRATGQFVTWHEGPVKVLFGMDGDLAVMGIESPYVDWVKLR